MTMTPADFTVSTSTDHPQAKRQRRRSSATGRISTCAREGCARNAQRGRKHCSALDAFLASELESAQRIVEAVGAGGMAGQMWAALVSANDALTEYRELESQLRAVAAETGIGPDAWGALRRGAYEPR